MSRTRQVLWASALSGASVFVSMAAALVLLKLATLHLTVEAFAVFVLVRLWADAFNLLSSLGLASALPRIAAAAPPEERDHTIAAALTGNALFATALAATGGLLCIGLADRIAPMLSAENARFAENAWLVAPLFLVGVLRDTAMAALAGTHRYVQRAASIVITSVLTVTFAAVAVWRGHASIATFAGALIAGHGLNLLWLYAALPARARWRLDAAGYRRAVRESFALYNNSLLGFVYQRLDVLIAQRYLGLEVVGLLGAAKNFPGILSQVMGALLVPLLPNLAALVASGEDETAARVLNRAASLVAFLGYSAVLVSMAFALPLLRLISSEAYLGAAPVLGWLMAGMVLAVQAGIMGQGLIALGRAASVTKVNLIFATVSLGLNLLLMPRFGLVAAGYTAVISLALSAAAQAWLVHRAGLALQWGRHVRMQALFAAALVLQLLGVLPLATLVAFPAAAIALRALPLEDLLALRVAFGKLRA